MTKKTKQSKKFAYNAKKSEQHWKAIPNTARNNNVVFQN